MDEYVYSRSLENDLQIEPFTDKQVLWISDSNNGSYNGQIQIETSQLSNSGRFCDYNNAYLEVPYVVSMSSTVDISAASVTNQFMVQLKNNIHLIDSLQVELNGTNIVQLCPQTSYYANFKMLTSFSQDEMQKWGASLGFSKDSAGSFQYSTGTSASGPGFSNNTMNPTQAYSAAQWSSTLEFYNEAALERGKRCINSGNRSGQQYGYGLVANSNVWLSTMNSASAPANSRSYFGDNNGAGAARIYQWVMLCTIRLKDISDYFAKSPLMRGSMYRFIINYNASEQVITTGANSLALTSCTTTGRTNPLLIASAQPLNPSTASAALSPVLTIRSGILRTSNSTLTPAISSVRLYVPTYLMNPDFERTYIDSNPTKTIVYEDTYSFPITGISAGSQFSQILTTGLSNLRKIVIMPLVNTASLGTTLQGLALTEPQSPFDSCPNTCAPLASITNFNILVSGSPIFQAPINYGFQHFIDELASMNSVNGGCSTITSGLLDQYDFENAYGYVVADLSRRLPDDVNKPHSVLVQGQNNSALTMDYVCFLAYERQITVSPLTSQVFM